MTAYILRRLLLILPTLLIILLVNFVIIQAAPGGPVEQAVARLQGIGGGAPGAGSDTLHSDSRASRGTMSNASRVLNVRTTASST